MEKIKEILSPETWVLLEKQAGNMVSESLKMSLVEDYRDNYYRQNEKDIFKILLSHSEEFERVGLKISPQDIVSILFRSQILFATTTVREFEQRSGGYFPRTYLAPISFAKKSKGIDVLRQECFNELETFIEERILLSTITCFHPQEGNEESFNNLFKKLNIPFQGVFNDEKLLSKYQVLHPDHDSATISHAQDFFQAPSIGFRTTGSELYCYYYSNAWLVTFFNMLRISGFIYPAQIDFGRNDIEFIAPTGSVFQGTSSSGCFFWDQDKREPWQRISDGSLFVSFGYRGLSGIWLDQRGFRGIEKFFSEYKSVFGYLENPWNERYINDIAPTLDLLSSAAQIPDIGGKILLIYCSLEHLFTPKNTKKDNRQYVIGGINALRPDLLEWFNDLYGHRCSYAHKGYVLKNDEILNLIRNSMDNVMALLIAKCR